MEVAQGGGGRLGEECTGSRWRVAGKGGCASTHGGGVPCFGDRSGTFV